MVGDWVQLVYLANTDAYREGIQVYDQTLRFEPYGWGLPNGSPLRDPINRQMIQVLRSDIWPKTVRGLCRHGDKSRTLELIPPNADGGACREPSHGPQRIAALTMCPPRRNQRAT